MPAPSTQIAVHLKIQGRVQGVGFRFFTQALAVKLSLVGWVRNLPDGGVEAYAEGPRVRVEAFLEQIRQGPPMSRVERVDPTWRTPELTTTEFSIQ